MPEFHGTIDFGDDRLRTYRVIAPTINDAEARLYDHAIDLLTVSASDDAEHYDEYDDTLEASVGDHYVGGGQDYEVREGER